MQRRIELLKDQESKYIAEEEVLKRRLELEHQSAANQAISFRQSLESSKKLLDDLTTRYNALDEEKKSQFRESSSKIMQMEETIASQKQINHDLMSRLHFIEDKHNSLNDALNNERMSFQQFREQMNQLEEKLSHEKKSLAQKVIELQAKNDQVNEWLQQKEQQLRDATNNHQESQEGITLALHDALEKVNSLNAINKKLRGDLESFQEERKHERKVTEESLKTQLNAQEALYSKINELEKNILLLESQKHMQMQSHVTMVTELESSLQSLKNDLLEQRKAYQDLHESFTQEKLSKSTLQLSVKNINEIMEKFLKEEKMTLGGAFDEAETIINPVKKLQFLLLLESKEKLALKDALEKLRVSSSEMSQSHQQRIESLEDTLITTAKTHQDLEAQYKDLQENFNVVKKNCLNLQEIVLKSEAELKESKERQRNLEDEINAVKQKNLEIAGRYKDANDHNEMMKTTLGELKENERNLSQEKNDLKTQLTRSNAEVTRLTEKCQKLEEIVTEKENKSIELDEKCYLLMQQLQEEKNNGLEHKKALETSMRKVIQLEESEKTVVERYNHEIQGLKESMARDQVSLMEISARSAGSSAFHWYFGWLSLDFAGRRGAKASLGRGPARS